MPLINRNLDNKFIWQGSLRPGRRRVLSAADITGVIKRMYVNWSSRHDEYFI